MRPSIRFLMTTGLGRKRAFSCSVTCQCHIHMEALHCYVTGRAVRDKNNDTLLLLAKPTPEPLTFWILIIAVTQDLKVIMCIKFGGLFLSHQVEKQRN